jgi:hypothetical protein
VTAAALCREGDTLTLACRVQPRARVNAFAGIRDGEVVVRLTAPPVDGKANEALRAFVAEAFAVSLSSVTIRSGERSRHKRLSIRGPAHVPDALQALGVVG